MWILEPYRTRTWVVDVTGSRELRWSESDPRTEQSKLVIDFSPVRLTINRSRLRVFRWSWSTPKILLVRPCLNFYRFFVRFYNFSQQIFFHKSCDWSSTVIGDNQSGDLKIWFLNNSKNFQKTDSKLFKIESSKIKSSKTNHPKCQLCMVTDDRYFYHFQKT